VKKKARLWFGVTMYNHHVSLQRQGFDSVAQSICLSEESHGA